MKFEYRIWYKSRTGDADRNLRERITELIGRELVGELGEGNFTLTVVGYPD